MSFSPFEIYMGKYPQVPLDLIPLPSCGKESKKANEWIDHLKEIQASTCTNFCKILGDKYKEFVDRCRWDVRYQLGKFI